MEKSLEKKVEELARLLREIQAEQRKELAEIKGMVGGLSAVIASKK